MSSYSHLSKQKAQQQRPGFHKRRSIDTRPSKVSGFSLMELVFTIVILGVLSAVAIPRFINLQSEARTAKVEAVHGAIASATDIVHSAGQVRQATSTVSLSDGTAVQLVHGYPAANASGIIAATSLGQDSSLQIIELGNGALTVKISPDNASEAGSPTCSVTYIEATATESPVLIKNTAAC